MHITYFKLNVELVILLNEALDKLKKLKLLNGIVPLAKLMIESLLILIFKYWRQLMPSSKGFERKRISILLMMMTSALTTVVVVVKKKQFLLEVK